MFAAHLHRASEPISLQGWDAELSAASPLLDDSGSRQRLEELPAALWPFLSLRAVSSEAARAAIISAKVELGRGDTDTVLCFLRLP